MSNSSDSAKKDTAQSPGTIARTVQRRFPKAYAHGERWARSRLGTFVRGAWAWRRPLVVAFVLSSFGVQYIAARREIYLRDYVHPDTYLVWKVHDGCVVESRHAPSLSQLLAPTAPGDEPPRVLEMYEVLHALKYAQRDPRVRGLFADFSALHVPTSVTPKRLGLAQIEELLQALVRDLLTLARVPRGKA